MTIRIIPDWMVNLDDEDVVFIKNFVLESGSLKQIASIYNVTYPTVRLRLDRLIQKINITENDDKDTFISLIKRLAIDERIDFTTAKLLVTEYNKSIKKGDN
ncbi:DUF2089 family protein [Paenibacillus farraposensis]|uniref:DUF2089 family protein n=1 Tax=Paenibacillus farraposensis TaxID=2807095 RepID=A0ABW4DHD7_9BACL|nr:DUF2089 family protein [Paenibacillus farraposensis]MCC3378189.1 DUF2089 family protein [Paenibacillus farraposensis]